MGVLLGLSWGDMGIMEKKMDTTKMSYIGSRISGRWVSCYNIPKAICYLLQGDCQLNLNMFRHVLTTDRFIGCESQRAQKVG